MTKDVIDMVDVIHANVHNLPVKTRKVAGYITGSPDIRWTSEDWARFKNGSVVRINQSDQVFIEAPVVDVERGAMTIPVAVESARRRSQLGRMTTIYIQESNLQACEDAVRAANLENHVLYWVANWSLSRDAAVAMLGGRIVAVQYGDPASNPRTKVPGSNLTIGEVSADISVTLASWFPEPHKPGIRGKLHKPQGKTVKKVIHLHPKTVASGSGSGLATGLVAILAGSGVHITVTEAAALAGIIGLILSYLTPPKVS